MSARAKRICAGLLATVVLAGANKLIEGTRATQEIERLAFRILQYQLSDFSGAKRLPVVVVDMSRVPGRGGQVTSREVLRSTLEAIVAQRPATVGVDVDFSPNGTGWIVDSDPQFFDFCLALTHEKHIPIFLGVDRTRAEDPKTWLGLPTYKELATALRVEADTTRLPRWLQPEGSSDRLPMLSSALAQAYPSKPLPSRVLAYTLETTRDNMPGIERAGEDRMIFGLSLVNYSKLEQIQHDTVPAIPPDSLAELGKLFEGKIVVIGDATESEDHFNVPGWDEPIPGVYLIACAAYTLVAEPLYELNTATRFALDMGVSLLMILWVEQLRYRYVRKREGPIFLKKKGRAIVIAIAIVFLFGILMVRFLNIMWFDFPLALFALVFHPKVEHLIWKVWQEFKGFSLRKRTTP